VLDTVVSEGSNQINGVMFAIADDEKLKDEARKLAIADAERKAKLYAETTRISLGQIMSLNEGHYQLPQPVHYGKQVRQDAAVPIAQGEQTVAIDVNITWEIK
jgi:uncharacterized protein YggE